MPLPAAHTFTKSTLSSLATVTTSSATGLSMPPKSAATFSREMWCCPPASCDVRPPESSAPALARPVAIALLLRPDALVDHRTGILAAGMADDIEDCFERGVTDGLPVVPPTRERVERMLS